MSKDYLLDTNKIKKEYKSIRNFERSKEIPIKTLYRYIHQENVIKSDFEYIDKLQGYLIEVKK